MDQLYSILLLFALIFGGIGLISTGSIILSGISDFKPIPKSTVICLVSGLFSLVFGITSAWVHRVFGHGTGSVHPMSIFQFFSHHSAFWIVLVLALCSFYGYFRLRLNAE